MPLKGQSQHGAPRAAEHQPAFDAEMLPQTLDIGDQVRCRIVGELCHRWGAAGATLIEEDDGGLWVEEPPMHELAAAARTAVHEQHRDALGLPALLEV